MTIRCHIITLNPDSDQVGELIATLNAQGIEWAPYSGVDGRQAFPALKRNEAIDNAKALRRHLATPTPSEVGCYLSHYRLIRNAFERGDEAICILEDDVMLEPGFGAVLGELEKRLDLFELTRLMGLRRRKRKVIETLPDGVHELVRPERGWCGGQSYVVSRPGMKKIIDQGAGIYEPIDKLYDHFWEFDLKLLGVEPHVAYERPHESSILKSDIKRSRTSPQAWLLYRLTKGILSLRRHAYLKAHRADFYPAAMPARRLGRTQRIK